LGALGITAVAFLPTLLSFHDVWVRQPYTHGYLLLAAVVWLGWRNRRALVADGMGWSAALPLSVFVSLVWLVAHITDVQVVEQAALPVLLLLWVAASLGQGVAAPLVPLAALLLLAVPLWEVLVPPLQWLTVVVTGATVRLLRIPALIEGNVVHIPSGSFLIEGGCAGLNYFLAALVIGAVYAQTFLRVWPARLVSIGLVAGLSVVGNWLRVSSLIAIGYATEMQSDLMTGHMMYGWLIFALGVLAFLPLTKRIEAWQDRRWPSAGKASASGGEPGPSGATIRTRAVVRATAAVILGPALYFAIGLLPARQVPPSEIGGSRTWLSSPRAERPFMWRPDFQGASEELEISYTSGIDHVLLDRFVYRARDRRGELIGFSSRIAPDTSVVTSRILGQIGPERRLVNEVIVRDGSGHVLVWYWYRVAGVETPSAARAKALEVWAFFTRAQTSELISISSPCAPDDCSGAARALSSFLGA
jgi:EpsI family protein